MEFDNNYYDVKVHYLYNYHISSDDIHSGVKILNINKFDNENDDTVVPLRYIQFTDNLTVFAVVPECKNFINEYVSKYRNDLFSDEGYEYLFEVFSEYMKKHKRKPYIANEEVYKHMIYYMLDNKSNIKYDKIQKNTLQFDSSTIHINATDSYQPLWDGGVYFGTLIDNEIVSIVGTNTPIQNKVIDIGLETHIDYRQKGLALSNVAAMSKYLVDNGHIVLYGCNNKNTNSIKTAISSGFKEVAKEKILWFINS